MDKTHKMIDKGSGVLQCQDCKYKVKITPKRLQILKHGDDKIMHKYGIAFGVEINRPTYADFIDGIK